MLVFKLMFNSVCIEEYDTLEEANEECALKNYELESEQAYLKDYDYHRYYVLEEIKN